MFRAMFLDDRYSLGLAQTPRAEIVHIPGGFVPTQNQKYDYHPAAMYMISRSDTEISKGIISTANQQAINVADFAEKTIKIQPQWSRLW